MGAVWDLLNSVGQHMNIWIYTVLINVLVTALALAVLSERIDKSGACPDSLTLVNYLSSLPFTDLIKRKICIVIRKWKCRLVLHVKSISKWCNACMNIVFRRIYAYNLQATRVAMCPPYCSIGQLKEVSVRPHLVSWAKNVRISQKCSNFADYQEQTA